MATSGTGAIATRGNIVAHYTNTNVWKNSVLPTTSSDTRCATASWINSNLSSQ